ncbi:MAG TPA: Gfo/Idh/MocA family oxidoreductase [Flavisolibacter sp.]|nr:Gfo/Idh/MocA family oxidoreductase [Flavisolibacter sp.]
MSDQNSSKRRRFLKQIGASTLLFASGPFKSLALTEKNEERILRYQRNIIANDRIRIGIIGLGIMGYNDLHAALQVPGIELAGVCDLYKGRLEHAKELYGNNLFTANDYHDLLNRKDIDAIMIATSDNWHARITKEALLAGKAVYCEKPMVQDINEGLPVIETQKKTGKTMQVGSQFVSNIVYAKAGELYRSGEIGKLNLIEASFDRQSALGAWEYTMPTDVSRETVDWERYIAGTPAQAFDPKKFFWWRNYRKFGTGVAGDLFVHLISGVHVITGAIGPDKIYSSGQLSYWKDGRDVPDVMTGILNYPETKDHGPFQVMLRVNFISGQGDVGSLKLVGEEGVIDLRSDSLNIHHSIMPKAPGIGGWDSLTTYPKAMQEEIIKKYNSKYSMQDKDAPAKQDISFKAPEGYNDHLDHVTNFFDGVRTGKPVIEDAAFGFRAAAPALACNKSYFEKKIINWDPVKMQIKNV